MRTEPNSTKQKRSFVICTRATPMEDYQPNEVRLDRKGKSSIPAIKVVRRGGHHGSFSGFDSSRGRSPNRPLASNQRYRGYHSMRPDFRNYPNKTTSASSSNPSGQLFDQIKLERSGNFARSGQHLFNRRHSPQHRDSQRSHFPRQGIPRANVSLDRSQFPKPSQSNREIQPVFHEMAQSSHAVHMEQNEGEFQVVC